MCGSWWGFELGEGCCWVMLAPEAAVVAACSFRLLFWRISAQMPRTMRASALRPPITPPTIGPTGVEGGGGGGRRGRRRGGGRACRRAALERCEPDFFRAGGHGAAEQAVAAQGLILVEVGDTVRVVRVAAVMCKGRSGYSGLDGHTTTWC